MKRARHAARELAMKILYQWDVRGGDPDWEALPDLLAESRDPDVRAFAETLVRGCVADRPAIDAQLKAVAKHWDVDRMAVLDRNILRLGAWELLRQPQTPRNVVINEAIELAKMYGTDKSGAFVNGILDQLKPAAAGGQTAGEKPSGTFTPAAAEPPAPPAPMDDDDEDDELDALSESE